MKVIVGVAAAVLWVTGAQAADVKIERLLPGYMCEQLTLTADDARDVTLQVLAREAPSRQSPIVGYTPMIVAVRAPEHRVNGFVEALWPTGRTVWIPADVLEPYHSLSLPNTRCAPALLSNGLVGEQMSPSSGQ